MTETDSQRAGRNDGSRSAPCAGYLPNELNPSQSSGVAGCDGSVKPHDCGAAHRALDLFCGRGGASRGLKAAGYYVVGVDIEDQPEYCGDEFHKADALLFPLEGFDFVWASSPCQEFAKWGMRHWHPNPRFPHEGLRLFNGTRGRLWDSGIPHVMENVRAAQMFVGDSINHLGPFHLWGNAVPACFPPELYAVKKGIQWKHGTMDGGRQWSSKSKQRKEYSAMIAMLPLEVCKFIGEVTLRELMRREKGSLCAA